MILIERGGLMKIHYLYHSGFFIEQEHHYLLFDYYQGTLPLLDKEKPLYIFISHAHYDHYNPAVLSLATYYPKCRIIAADLHEEGFLEVRPDERYIVDDIEIQTLNSTDEGVAFLIKSEGSYLYHAGDLHLWYWEEDTKQQRREMYERYRNEVEKLKGIPIDAAFVVLDSRQEEKDALAGIELFNEIADAKYVFVMHFSDDEDKMEERLLKIKNNRNIINTRRNTCYEI